MEIKVFTTPEQDEKIELLKKQFNIKTASGVFKHLIDIVEVKFEEE